MFVTEWEEAGRQQVGYATEREALAEAERQTARGVRWVCVWELDDPRGK